MGMSAKDAASWAGRLQGQVDPGRLSSILPEALRSAITAPPPPPRAPRFHGAKSQAKSRKAQEINRIYSLPLPAGPYLAIDPSSCAMGWAVRSKEGKLQASGTFRPSHSAGAEDRNTQICRKVVKLIQDYSACLVILETSERPAYNRAGGLGTKGAIIFGRACGDVEGAAIAIGAKVAAIDVRAWKRTATKFQIMLQYQIPAGTDDNEADAIAMGDWYLNWVKPLNRIGAL
jgi:Holliday junction resolvasome RuvABC endonuclease subunit